MALKIKTSCTTTHDLYWCLYPIKINNSSKNALTEPTVFNDCGVKGVLVGATNNFSIQVGPF